MKEKMSGSGNPMYGKTHSPETIEKMAAMKRGVNNPNSDGLTEEHRRKIGNAHRGRPKNELQRETCRDRSKGNKYAVKTLLITLPTGEEITVTDRKRFCAEYGYKYYYIDFALRKGEHNGLRVRYL